MGNSLTCPKKHYVIEFVCGCGYREKRKTCGFQREEWPHPCSLSGKDVSTPN